MVAGIKKNVLDKISKYNFLRGEDPKAVIMSTEDYAILVEETDDLDLEDIDGVPIAVVQCPSWKTIEVHGGCS